MGRLPNKAFDFLVVTRKENPHFAGFPLYEAGLYSVWCVDSSSRVRLSIFYSDVGINASAHIELHAQLYPTRVQRLD